MSDLRTAAKQALESLEMAQDHWSTYHGLRSKTIDDAADTLRAALEQPEQEPVAFWHKPNQEDEEFIHAQAVNGKCLDCVPLFTHPPRREWRGLTDQEMHGLYRRAGLEAYYPRDGVVQYEYERRLDEYAHSVEAALKERNA
jgi:hypothetical protein